MINMSTKFARYPENSLERRRRSTPGCWHKVVLVISEKIKACLMIPKYPYKSHKYANINYIKGATQLAKSSVRLPDSLHVLTAGPHRYVSDMAGLPFCNE